MERSAEQSKPLDDSERPWHIDFPTPQSLAASISRETVLQMFYNGQVPGRDFLMIDLRRIDHEGGTIKGSLNLPAQSLWHSLGTLYELCNAAGFSKVIFYCGSSRGRGVRAAGWFQDTIQRYGNTTMRSEVLADGIKGWFGAGDEYTALVAGYTKTK